MRGPVRAFTALGRFLDTHALALQLPHGIGHADVLEHGVVPASGPGRVPVEGAQVAVEPVGAARARDAGEPLPDLARAESRVNKNARFVGLEVGAIAG